jgi:hypothetical protein
MLRNNLQIKGVIFPILPYLNFFALKDPLKKDDVEQKMFGKSCIFNSEKSFAFAICGKCCG